MKIKFDIIKIIDSNLFKIILDLICFIFKMPNNKWIADLKTVFQVAKARLDVREKKKTEQVAKERYTIADYVRNNKVPRARIGKYLTKNSLKFYI